MSNPKLTPRQAQIAALLPEPLTFQQIGDRLGISRNTVKNHIYSHDDEYGTHRAGLYERLGVETRLEAAMWAYHQGLGQTIDQFMSRRHDERAAESQ